MHRNKGKIYLKKDCVGCKAFTKGSCRLNIPIEQHTVLASHYGNTQHDYSPLEPCPKPRTWNKLQEALQTFTDKRDVFLPVKTEIDSPGQR